MPDPLIDPELTIVIAYAPAGLGHLRVSRALFLGLPKESQPILLPDTAMSIQSFHRLTSITPLGRRLMVWGQYGLQEEIVTRIYRLVLSRDATRMQQTLASVLKQRVELPKTLLIVATHFGVAHQIGLIKKKLEKAAKVKIILVVQVTDDSPQRMWYVPNADLITVPSRETKRDLDTYGKAARLILSPIRVNPYPVSPILTTALDDHEYEVRIHQASPESERLISMSVPVSGAAVGTDFALKLMHSLHHRNNRFLFHVVTKRTVFTLSFLHSLERKDYVNVYQSHSDRQIVELYEQMFEHTVFLAEITKPSEQAFKALISPRKRGGVILLFTPPVGRQEYDNLNFLRRHELLLSEEETIKLYDVWKKKQNPSIEFLNRLKTLRALLLPDNPDDAASFIYWLHTTYILHQMVENHHRYEPSPEVSDDGVKQFWDKVKEML